VMSPCDRVPIQNALLWGARTKSIKPPEFRSERGGTAWKVVAIWCRLEDNLRHSSDNGWVVRLGQFDWTGVLGVSRRNRLTGRWKQQRLGGRDGQVKRRSGVGVACATLCHLGRDVVYA